MASPTQVRRSADLIRTELRLRGRPHAKFASPLQLHLLLKRTGDVGLAADALLIKPRPAWLVTLCGPFPENLEMLHPDDVALAQEWGDCG